MIKRNRKNYQQQYYQKNKRKLLAYVKKWTLNNKEYRKQYKKEYEFLKRHNDIAFKLLTNCRNRLYQSLKGINKSLSTMFLIGCEIDYLIYHLQCQFKKGMNWDNYGKEGWVIDHKIPCCVFDLKKKSEQLKCFNYKNLQPLWARDNYKKWNYFSL